MATKFDIKTLPSDAQVAAQRNFYAYVGAADLAVEVVREAVADAQQRLTAVQEEWTARITELQKKGAELDLDPRALVAELQAAPKELPARVQKLVDANVASATETYEDLAKRGESLVGRIRRQQSTKDAVKSAKTTVTKAKTTRTQATKTAKATKVAPAAKKEAAAARSSAKATVTSARKTASKTAKAVVDAAEKVGD